jgi:archaeal type IV pilus assembly protein PilA
MKHAIHTHKDRAVSPVVGVMLMLVVTIIIAAVVSAFSGGLVTSQKKVPSASIQATYSITDGMVIRHMGGDPLATSDLVFTIEDGNTFRADAGDMTRQELSLTNLTDSDGTPVKATNGTYNFGSFRPGDVLLISADSSSCNNMQPTIANQIAKDGGSISGSTCSGSSYCDLCIRYTNAKGGSVGNQFTLMLSDRKGNMIGKTDVKVTT